MLQKIQTKILDKKDLSKDVKLFILETPKDFDYKAGQYVLIELEIEKQIQRRAYSIASSPNNKGKIELCIKKVSKTGFANELFKLPVRKEISLMGPIGKFFINKKPKQDLVFISVGTGIAPFKSMIEHLLKTLNFKKQITLIHGYRHEEDVLYKKSFSKLEKQFPNFKQNIVLSQPKKISKKIQKGHVQDFIKKPETKTNYYICGMKIMVEEVSKKLNSLGVSSENIFFEKYD